jgi:hypothetical protein
MEGKPAGVFTSTASTPGGQETTCITMPGGSPLSSISFEQGRRGYVPGDHLLLPSIALTNSNRGMIALELYGISGLPLNSDRTILFSSFANLIATRTYTVREILIDRNAKVPAKAKLQREAGLDEGPKSRSLIYIVQRYRFERLRLQLV